MAKNENEKNETPKADETAPPVATSDVSLLNEDALSAYKFMTKAVDEANRLNAGNESEAETLFRIFETQTDDATVGSLRSLVTKARENVPDEETVKIGLAKARKRYDAGLDAWNDEETPEGFVLPEFPNVKGSKSGSATGRGAGVPRPRGLRAATKEHGLGDLKAEKGYLTCATLAQKVGNGLTTAMLFDAWKSVAGEDSETWTDGQSETVTVKGTDGTEIPVTFYYSK